MNITLLKKRLERYRAQALKENANRGTWRTDELATWQSCRRQAASWTGRPPPQLHDGNYYPDAVDEIGDYLGDTDDLCKEFGFSTRGLFATSGYFTDYHGNGGTVVPGVTFLRTSRCGLYIPTTLHTENDGVTLYMTDAEELPKKFGNDRETAIAAALRAAHGHAEKEADVMREEDVQWQAEQKIEVLLDEIPECRIRIRACVGRLRAARGYYNMHGLPISATCTRLEDKIDEHWEEMRDKWKEVRDIERDPWSAVH